MGRPFTLDRPEKRRRFLQVLAQTRRNKVACEAIGLDESCLYKYLKRHPEFAAERYAALDKFDARDDPELAARCREAYLLMMRPHEVTRTTFETITHPDGTKTEIRKVHKEERPPEQWAVQNCTPLMSGRPAGEGRSRMELTGADGSPLVPIVSRIVMEVPGPDDNADDA